MVKFIRTIEDFTCGHCEAKVKGNGYTNHCPKCLWSKHVDNYPGDRENGCGGLMEPVWLEIKDGRYSIKHRCVNCGAEAHCKASDEDDIAAMAELSETLAKKAMF